MSTSDQYDADYYLRGRETGKSLYANYRWLPESTIPMVRAIVAHLNLDRRHSVLDFGCARGYVVRALRGLGYRGYGVDASEWAVANADDAVRDYVSLARVRAGEHCASLTPPPQFVGHHWIIAKDVLEHLPDAADLIECMMVAAGVGVFAVVPLAAVDGFNYVCPDYELDKTHVQRWTLPTWTRAFIRPGWAVEARYRLPGVKDNWYTPEWRGGNGFITARRVEG